MAKLGGMRRRKKTIGREEMVEGIRGIRRKMKGSEGGGMREKTRMAGIKARKPTGGGERRLAPSGEHLRRRLLSLLLRLRRRRLQMALLDGDIVDDGAVEGHLQDLLDEVPAGEALREPGDGGEV